MTAFSTKISNKFTLNDYGELTTLAVSNCCVWFMMLYPVLTKLSIDLLSTYWSFFMSLVEDSDGS